MKVFPDMTNKQSMELRDYFAAQAMQILLKHDSKNCERLLAELDNVDHMLIGCVAEGAYEMANAMMEARAAK